ncbi:Winged helix DNA-binding domain-containing protein [Plasmodiophora brassicae]|uniref:Winged helix DNA-binding domain-containing protein n=1 Tax=Plasmodiophora brassicae TaxID=37360 RepID=A0A0G4IQF4_PLABS|nr:hypothetical protein PBRA_000724 [Plasmodiophora brassicae]SPQ97690.1 unnamed protein product [Plasmodiophora brassicae]
MKRKRPAESAIPWQAVVHFRCIRNGLVGGGFETAVDVCKQLFGIQAQEVMPSLISIWNRLASGAHAASDGRESDVTHEHVKRRDQGLIRIWAQRGTLHVFHFDDWPLARSCTGDKVIAMYGARIDAMSKTLEQQLLKKSPRTILDKTKDPDARHIRMVTVTEGRAAWHIGEPHARRLTCREEIAPGLKWNLPERHDALVDAATRYFNAYGPATEPDFRYMMGIHAGPSKAAVEHLIRSGILSTVAVDRDGQEMELLILSDLVDQIRKLAQTTKPLGFVRLLYKFDPVLLAHKDKSWLIDGEHKQHIWAPFAQILPSVVVNGRIRGTWQYKRNTNGDIAFAITLFDSVKDNDDIRSAVALQVAGLAKFLGASSYTVEY